MIETFPKEGLKPKWTATVGPGYTGPAVAKGLVVLMDRVSPTAAPENPLKRANSDGTERVIALNAKTGKGKWDHEYGCEYKNVSDNAGPRTTPVIDGDRVYTLGTMGDLRCLTLADGKPVVMRPAVTIATPKVVGDRVFISNYYHGAIALTLGKEKPTADVLWRAKNNYPKKPDTLNTVMSSLLAHDGHIDGLCMNGEMKCLKGATGEVVWTDQTLLGGKNATFGSTSWVQNGDTVYRLTDTGDQCVLKLSPKGDQETARTHLIDPTAAAGGRKVTWAHPAFADQHLFTRNGKELICVSLAKE